MLYDACLYDIYLHIPEYLHDENETLLWKLSLNKIGSCHGTGFVVTAGTAGCHNDHWCRQRRQSGLSLDYSLFVYLLKCLFMIQTMEFFRYYHTVSSRSIYISHPSFIQILSTLLHRSPVRARYGVSFVAYGFWWESNQSCGFLLPVLFSISCYTDRDISKASSNYIREMNVSHISYIMLTCIISLP